MTRAHRMALAALLALTALLTLVPAALADRTFSLRYQTIDRAESVLVSNTLMTCSGGGCSGVRNGTDTSQGNGDFTEVNVNTDSDATTFSSSSANLTLPVGATVKFAGLYWGADTTAGTGGSAAPTPASNNLMKFRTPALAGYTDVTASVVDTDSQRVSRYQGFADVTALVQAGGAGTYWGANVQAGTGADRYAGWSLVVVYTDSSKSIQQVGIYDGLTSLVAASRPSVTIPLDSFQTPATGTVNAKVGLVAWEGDADIVQRDRDAQRLDPDRRGQRRRRTSSTRRSPAPARTSRARARTTSTSSASTRTRSPPTASSRTARRARRSRSGPRRTRTCRASSRSRTTRTSRRPRTPARRRSPARRPTAAS